MFSHLNPQQKDFFQKLTVSQQVKQISKIYANRMFTPPSLHKLSPFVHTSTTWTQSTSSHPFQWRLILVLRSHPRTELLDDFFPSVLPTKTLLFSPPFPHTRHIHRLSLSLIILIVILWRVSICNFLWIPVTFSFLRRISSWTTVPSLLPQFQRPS